jgi:hypothetical protein
MAGIPATETCPLQMDFFDNFTIVGHVLEGLVNGGGIDHEMGWEHNLDALFSNNPIEPRRVNGIVDTFLGFRGV